VYQSADDGVTWSHAFTRFDKYYYAQHAIKVPSDTDTDIFYALLGRVGGEWRLREYKRKFKNNVSLRNVAFRPGGPISLAFDGRSTVFATQPTPDKTLRVFSSRSTYGK
jgi:hypothetical protein